MDTMKYAYSSTVQWHRSSYTQFSTGHRLNHAQITPEPRATTSLRWNRPVYS